MAAAASLRSLDGSQLYEIPHGRIKIGRKPHDCDLVLPQASISSTHAQIEMDNEDSALLTDLHSTNGTYLNSVKVYGVVRIVHGDRVQFGTHPPFIFERKEKPFDPNEMIARVAAEAQHRHEAELNSLKKELQYRQHTESNESATALERRIASLEIKMEERPLTPKSPTRDMPSQQRPALTIQNTSPLKAATAATTFTQRPATQIQNTSPSKAALRPSPGGASPEVAHVVDDWQMFEILDQRLAQENQNNFNSNSAAISPIIDNEGNTNTALSFEQQQLIDKERSRVQDEMRKLNMMAAGSMEFNANAFKPPPESSSLALSPLSRHESNINKAVLSDDDDDDKVPPTSSSHVKTLTREEEIQLRINRHRQTNLFKALSTWCQFTNDRLRHKRVFVTLTSLIIRHNLRKKLVSVTKWKNATSKQRAADEIKVVQAAAANNMALELHKLKSAQQVRVEKMLDNMTGSVLARCFHSWATYVHRHGAFTARQLERHEIRVTKKFLSYWKDWKVQNRIRTHRIGILCLLIARREKSRAIFQWKKSTDVTAAKLNLHSVQTDLQRENEGLRNLAADLQKKVYKLEDDALLKNDNTSSNDDDDKSVINTALQKLNVSEKMEVGQLKSEVDLRLKQLQEVTVTLRQVNEEKQRLESRNANQARHAAEKALVYQSVLADRDESIKELQAQVAVYASSSTNNINENGGPNVKRLAAAQFLVSQIQNQEMLHHQKIEALQTKLLSSMAELDSNSAELDRVSEIASKASDVQAAFDALKLEVTPAQEGIRESYKLVEALQNELRKKESVIQDLKKRMMLLEDQLVTENLLHNNNIIIP